MEYTSLGVSGCSVSRIGFGCGPASGYDYGPVDESAWAAAVRAALSSGINFFDVADVYGFGRAEESLAAALGNQRHSVAIATKFGLSWNADGSIRRNSAPERIAQALEESLRRLRVDSITLYQLHWPDTVTPLDAVLEVLVRFKREGKVQLIGLCNVSDKQLKSVMPKFTVDAIQVPYNLLCRNVEETLLSWPMSERPSFLAHSPLARGLLAGERFDRPDFQGSDTRRESRYFAHKDREQKRELIQALRTVGQRTGRSASAVALRWTLDRREVTSALVGVKNVIQLEQNLGAVGWRLSDSDYQWLSSLSAACQGSMDGTLAGKGAGS